MRDALIVVGVLVVLGVLGLGALIWRAPATHEARASAVIAAPPEVVWATITDVPGHVSWRGLRRATRTGDRIEEVGADGDVVVMQVEVEDAPHRYVVRIVDNRSFGGTWTWTLTPDPGGTKVEIVENGEIYNPIFRVLAPLFHDNQATMNGVLAALAKRHPSA
jgi:uncharacterized protein YndB with AHSA1/START domain